jgi:hypothetical protein
VSENDTSGFAISADGTHAFFGTRDQLVPEDQDGEFDVYDRVGNTTQLASTGSSAAGGFSYGGSSADGRHLFFIDGGTTYDRHDGQTSLVSVGPGDGRTDGIIAGNSQDGSRVFFRRTEQPGFDFEIYQRYNGQTTLVSTGPNDDGSGNTCQLQGRYSTCPFELTPDGTTVAFWHSGNLVAQDTDDHFDVYAWHDNRPPRCGRATASPSRLSHAKRRLRLVDLVGVTDPDGDPVSLDITGVSQDEPTGGSADAARTASARSVLIRAERDRRGDGRVYRIAFTASDEQGAACTGTATVSVPRHGQAVDSAPPSYDSFAP